MAQERKKNFSKMPVQHGWGHRRPYRRSSSRSNFHAYFSIFSKRVRRYFDKENFILSSRREFVKVAGHGARG